MFRSESVLFDMLGLLFEIFEKARFVFPVLLEVAEKVVDALA